MSGKELVPPLEALFDGTSNHPDFEQIGDNFVDKILVGRAGLLPHHRILDVGSGNGQKARPLTSYLTAEGSYDGVEIVPAAVDWCRQAYASYPNFHFHQADVRSLHYNPRGKIAPASYQFSFPDESFDLVLLSSVFTHILPEGVENYFGEITRVLKPGGRAVITYFLWNEEAAEKISRGEDKAFFSHVHREGVCRLYSTDDVEQAVCYEENYIRSLYRTHGHNVAEVTYGFWCGRKDILGCQQDAIISVK
jgi:SAM-dependent methyltransferase